MMPTLPYLIFYTYICLPATLRLPTFFRRRFHRRSTMICVIVRTRYFCRRRRRPPCGSGEGASRAGKGARRLPTHARRHAPRLPSSILGSTQTRQRRGLRVPRTAEARQGTPSHAARDAATSSRPPRCVAPRFCAAMAICAKDGIRARYSSGATDTAFDSAEAVRDSDTHENR